jgi:endonuclease/exonuclease/phosphatase family metal-dependent hydrolase
VATVNRGIGRFRCYTVHLPAPLSISGSSRREQAQVLIADAAASPDPVVITGDFNSYDVGHEFAAAGFEWLTRDTGPTVERFLLDFRYDHVFARTASGMPARGTAGVVKDNRDASDHKAIWASFEFGDR